MFFKDLKVGYPIYMLHKDNKIYATTGKVVNISPSRFPQNGSNQTMQMVVDVTIEENGVSQTYAIPDSTSITCAGENLVIATSKEDIVRDAEAIKSMHLNELAKTDMRQAAVKDCDIVITEWSPSAREKKETEERFVKLENSLDDMKSMLSGLIKELKG